MNGADSKGPRWTVKSGKEERGLLYYNIMYYLFLPE